MLGISTADAQTCSVCPFGKYKDVDGNTPCTNCTANTYLNVAGATASNQCIDCPSFSTSGVGTANIANCQCNPGYYRPTGQDTCVSCPIGTFKSGSGNSVSLCVACLNTTTTLPGQTPPARAQSECTCGPGYTFQAGGATNCRACSAGTYKTTAGSQSCSNCPTNTITAAEASTELNLCLCVLGMTGIDGSSTCSGCTAGKYKATLGSEPCTNCPTGKYLQTGSASSPTACINCVTDSTTSTDGSVSLNACKCNAGFFTVNDNTPSKTCQVCAAGKFSVANSLACSSCGPGKYSIGGTTTENCETCVAGKYSRDGDLQCTSCLTNSWSPASSGDITACTCNAGFWPRNNPGQNGAACFECAAGTFKDASGPQNCTSCLANRYSSALGAVASSTCVTCPTSSSSPSGSATVTACLCDTGFIGKITIDTDTCTACVPGKFNNATAATVCRDCPRSTFSVAPAKKDNVCTSCGQFGTSPQGSSSSAACVCSAGYGTA